MYFVYILRSKSTDRFYIGHTDHLIRRYHQHALSFSLSTRNKGPWMMEYFEVYPSRGQAMDANTKSKIKNNPCVDSFSEFIAIDLQQMDDARPTPHITTAEAPSIAGNQACNFTKVFFPA
jgi:putative endonuclease